MLLVASCCPCVVENRNVDGITFLFPVVITVVTEHLHWVSMQPTAGKCREGASLEETEVEAVTQQLCYGDCPLPCFVAF